MAQAKINNTTILSDSKYVFRQIEYAVENAKGEWNNKKSEILERGNAAAVLLYNKESKTIILTRQFRIATYLNGNANGLLTEVCAGLVDNKETPEQTIIREIKEETGYAITNVQKVYQAYSSAGVLTELLHLYVAPYTKEQKVAGGGGLQAEGEDVQVTEMLFEQAIQMMDKGDIQDAKTIILLLHAQIKQLL